MSDLSKEDVESIRARMEVLGVNQVRSLMASGGWPHAYNAAALDWLAEKDQPPKKKAQPKTAEPTDGA